MDPANNIVIANETLKKIIVKVKDCAYEKKHSLHHMQRINIETHSLEQKFLTASKRWSYFLLKKTKAQKHWFGFCLEKQY